MSTSLAPTPLRTFGLSSPGERGVAHERVGFDTVPVLGSGLSGSAGFDPVARSRMKVGVDMGRGANSVTVSLWLRVVEEEDDLERKKTTLVNFKIRFFQFSK